MSTPHIAWAFAQRQLTAAQRVVLIALAERANGERTCFPSEETLACDCELSRRSVIAAVQYLRDDRGLIEVIKDPVERASVLTKAGANPTARVNVYRILRPADGAKSAPPPDHESAKSAHPHQANGAKTAPSTHHNSAKSSHNRVESEKSAPSGGSEGAKFASRECKKRQIERAPFAHEPLTESLHEKKREGVQVREAGKQAAAPTSPPQSTTPGSDDFNAYLDAPTPTKALAAEIEQDVMHADLPDPDAPVDPEYVRAVVADLRHEFRMRAYPPRAATMSPDDQVDVLVPKPRPRTAYLSPEVLRALRPLQRDDHAA
jgi:hypothetical protein